jgi:hypothetical protein
MPDGHGNRLHFGPNPGHGSGPEAAHAQIHKKAIGKTITAVYLGDSEPVRGPRACALVPSGRAVGRGAC